MTRGALASFVLFSALTAGAFAAISCYYGQINQIGNTRTGSVSSFYCPDSNYCMKVYYAEKSSNYNYNTYSCGDFHCGRSGCINYGNGYGQCCCSGTLCNSGFTYSKTSILALLVSVFYMFS
ncbi:unnamed protein product [Caenorhabditis sp. 36 PRJEB53466]|nr:unnamed protein product [Caenorhabditis sp. 36 PRJEB53466]